MVKELRALCMLSHSALIDVHGAFLSGDVVTLVLEYMDRGALDALLRTSRALRPSFTAAVAYQILDGLSYLHAKNVIHRDLKPSNVLLSSDGSVKICDFGLASVSAQNGSDASLNTTVLGTRKYMAPERLRAQAYGRSSDLWSFGLILLECVTGHPPWHEVTSEIELLVTIEETDIRELIPSGTEDGLHEMIQVSSHRNPGENASFVSLGRRTSAIHPCFPHSQRYLIAKRIPAGILKSSPWLGRQHFIVDRSSATRLVRVELQRTWREEIAFPTYS
jgi:serine/threonine protein kinase